MASSTTDRRLGLSGNAAIKTPCRAATTAAITLSGEQTIDSVSVVDGDRVLVKNQTTGADNGVYTADTGTWTRDLDFDGSYDARCGTLVLVTSGSTNGAGLFELTTSDPITIGTTSLTFTKIATLDSSSVTRTNVQNGQFVEVGTIAGTNTITGVTSGTAPSALGHGQYVFFVPANTNTGATTFNRDSLGAVNVFFNGVACAGGELRANVPSLLFHDGTQYNICGPLTGVQTGVLTSVAGTANAITATGPVGYSLSSSMPPIIIVPASTNTAATTLTITPRGGTVLTGKNVFSGGTACVGGELVAGVPAVLEYDGTQYNIVSGPAITKSTTSSDWTFDGGGGTTGAATLTHQKCGQFVALNIPLLAGTSGTGSTKLVSQTAIPAAYRPASTQWAPCFIVNNNVGLGTIGQILIATSGLISIYRDAATTAFTNSSVCGTGVPITITYFVG